MRTRTCAIIAATLLVGAMAVQARTPIGKAGDWAGTIAAATLDGKLYTVEKSGALYVTTPDDGAWKQIGKSDFANTSFLLSLRDQLVSIEKDGSLYRINPADGVWAQAGKAGDWAGTIAAATLNGKLYTVEKSGALYVTTPDDGAWKQIGKSDFANTRFLLSLRDQLVSIEKDGSLYRINPADGTWRRIGGGGDGKGSVAGVGGDTMIYVATADGAIHAIDPATGVGRAADADAHPGARFLLAAGRQLYTISADGNLAAVSLAGAGESKAAPAAAKTENLNPALAGQLTFKFMGLWKGDTTELEKDPEFQKHKAADPESVQGLVDLMKGMSMKVTLDGITMTVMGQTVGPFPFEALSAEGNSLVIENKDGPKKGVQSRIVFLSDKKIQVLEGADAGKAMFFRKD